MPTPRSPRFAVAATILAPLVVAAPHAWADDPSSDAGNAVLKLVTFDSTKPGTLIEKLSSAQDQPLLGLPMLSYEQSTWSPLCVTPCHVKVDLNGVYRVGPGNGVTASPSFTLSPDVVALHVRAGSSTARRWANGFLIAGSIALISGASTELAADDTSDRRAGLAVGGAGLLGILIGVPMYVLSSTHARFE